MIRSKIFVKNLTADYPFNGDPTKTWYCEIVDSNLNSSGNPVINSVRQGFVNMTCIPRQLNAELDVIFHTMDEKEAVVQAEKVAIISKAMPKIFTTLVFYFIKYFKKVVKWAIGLTIGSVVIASILFFVPTGEGSLARKAADKWEKLNTARIAMTINETVNETVDDMRDVAFFDSAGIQALELKYKMDYRSLFKRYDDKLYIMEDLVKDADKNVMLVEQDDADDYCQEMGGFLMDVKLLEDAIITHRRRGINKYSDYPEWSVTPRGVFSDDYALLKKDGPKSDGMYDDEENKGIYWGDDGDAKAGFRCGILRTDFVEEK